MSTATSTRNVLISCAGADQNVGRLVGEILREAGLAPHVQDEDLGSTAFTQRTDDGSRMALAGARIVALMSEAYLATEHCLIEALHPLTDDPMNERQRLVVLRVGDCEPTGLLNSIHYTDLEPLLGDAEGLARAVRGAVLPEQDIGAAQFAALFRRSGGRILHAEVRPVPEFAGREAELSAIDAALWSQGGKAALIDAGSRNSAGTTAVRGLGGVGKSVLARQYAWLNRERYAGVWWVRAETRDQMVADIAALGAHLMPGLEEMPNRAQAAQIALAAIAQSGGNKPWLMVYDNVESTDTIAELNQSAHAHMLITSRWADWSGHAAAVAVDVFPRPLAMEFLLSRARQADAHAAGRLADDLGGLPLALVQARATCWATGLDFDAYRAQLSEIIKRAAPGADYPEQAIATLELAIKHAVAQCPEAERLLAIAAHLAPNRIPLDIIKSDVMSESERDRAVAALSDVSLARATPLDDGSAGLTVHSLVQAVMRGRLAGRSNEVAALATRLLAQAYPLDADEVVTWPICQRLNEHAQAALTYAPETGEAAVWTGGLLNQLGQHMQARADFDTAEPLMLRALSIHEQRLGAEHADVAACLNNLADLLATTGRYAEAEPLMRRALAIDEASNGPQHPSVARDLGSLAQLLQDTNRLEEAEPLLRRALAIDEGARGPDHPDIAIDLGNLAMLLKATDRATEAEPLLSRALAISEASFAPDHPSIARDLNNLANLLHDTKRLDEAEPMMRRSLAITEASFGPEHPAVATRLNNLAVLLRDTSRLDEALPMMRRALAIDEASFGPEHPTVALKYANFAEILFESGRPSAADPYIRHAFLTAEKTLGRDHPETWAFRASYDKIIAAVDAIARRDDAVEAGLAPASPERLARPDIPAPPAKPGIMGRIFRRKA